MRTPTSTLLGVLLVCTAGCGAGSQPADGDGDTDTDTETDTDFECDVLPEDEADWAMCRSYGVECDECFGDDGVDPSPGTVCEYVCDCGRGEFHADFFGPYIGCMMRFHCGGGGRAHDCCAAAAAELVEPSQVARDFLEACEARRADNCAELSCEMLNPFGEAYSYAVLMDEDLLEMTACLEEPDCSLARVCIIGAFDPCNPE